MKNLTIILIAYLFISVSANVFLIVKYIDFTVNYEKKVKIAITTSGATLRDAYNGKKVSTVPKGVKVFITGKHVDWYKIRYQEQEGFIYHKLIEIENND